MFNRGHLINWFWLSIFLFGNFCTIEIDIRLFSTIYTHQFFTRRGLYNYFSNRTKVYKVSDSNPRGNNINIYI
jgi:hypothetical protein